MKSLVFLMLPFLFLGCSKEEEPNKVDSYVGNSIKYIEALYAIYDDHGEHIGWEAERDTIENTNDTLWVTNINADNVVIGSNMSLLNFAWADTIMNNQNDTLYFEHDFADQNKNLSLIGVGEKSIQAIGIQYDFDHNKPPTENRIEFTGELQ